LVAAVALGLVWGFGLDRLQSAGPVSAKGSGPIVRVVDPGLSQREKWAPCKEWNVFARYLKLSGAPQESDSAVVVWPEAAIPARYQDIEECPGDIVPPLIENPQMMAAIGRTMGDRVLIAGALRVDPQTRPPMIYNTAWVIDAVAGRPEIGQHHDKYRLTPGGEFIPLYDLISWLPIKSLQQIGEGFSRGDPPTRMVVPGAADVLVLICYESIFPGLVPRGAERPGWIANISIDAWYGNGTGPFQNDNQSRYRAIEEGLPMARAASGGISSITDAYGRSVVSMDRKGGAVEAPLPPALSETINARYGALLTAGLMLIIGLLRIAPFGRRRQDHHERRADRQFRR
jgi:apolipoprotein N-acyltransferase